MRDRGGSKATNRFGDNQGWWVKFTKQLEILGASPGSAIIVPG